MKCLIDSTAKIGCSRSLNYYSTDSKHLTKKTNCYLNLTTDWTAKKHSKSCLSLNCFDLTDSTKKTNCR